MEERLVVFNHSLLQPGPVSVSILGKFSVAKFESRYLVVLEQLKHLGLLSTQKALFVVYMRREYHIAPLKASVFGPWAFAFVKFTKVTERFLCRFA